MTARPKAMHCNRDNIGINKINQVKIRVFRRRDLARPLSEGEFRKSLERIWRKEKRLP